MRKAYASFAELEAACDAFMDEVNNREHRATRRVPAVMLEEEKPRLHWIPQQPHTVAFGLSRQVPTNTPMVTFDHGQYSVPSYLLGAEVFVRSHGVGAGEQIIIVHLGIDGPVEVARHQRTQPGSPAIDDAHFPGHVEKVPGDYTIKARSTTEAEFLGIGAGAHAWLIEAAAAGTSRMSTKMAEAIALAKISGTAEVDQALGTAAIYGRFATGDLTSILEASTGGQARRADENTSLAQGTAAWATLGQKTTGVNEITPVIEVTGTDIDAEDLEEHA